MPSVGHVRPVKIQIRLCIRTVWSESSLDTFWIGKDTHYMKNINEDTQEMSQSQSTTFPRHQKKERLGANNDKTNAT